MILIAYNIILKTYSYLEFFAIAFVSWVRYLIVVKYNNLHLFIIFL